MKAIRITAVALWCSVLAIGATPARADLEAEVNHAVAVLERLPDGAIPAEVLEEAYGLAIVDIFSLGAGFGLSGGQGVVVARTPDGWSPPSGIGFGGMSLGAQLGVKVTELVFVLNTPAAVEAVSEGNFELGVNASIALLPWGRTATGGITPDAAMFAYGRSQGLFGGISLSGTFIGVREKDNAEAYGKPVSAMSILRGEVAAPPEAAKLQEALSGY